MPDMLNLHASLPQRTDRAKAKAVLAAAIFASPVKTDPKLDVATVRQKIRRAYYRTLNHQVLAGALENLPLAASWAIASTLVNRRLDPSGCATLQATIEARVRGLGV